MSVLGAFVDAIGAVVPAAKPAAAVRFPLREDDQRALASHSIAAPDPATPDRLRIAVEVVAGGSAPAVLPLFGGRLTFTADDPDPPDPTSPGFDWADAATWPRQGRITVDLDQRATEEQLRKLGAALPLVPNRASYWPVVLPTAWLTEASIKAMAEKKAVEPGIKVGSPNWPKHALAAVLAGTHVLNLAADAASLPTVVLGADRKGTLTIALSRVIAAPDDGATDELATAAADLDPLDPAHPANAPLPARRILSTLGAAGPVAATVAGARWVTIALGTPGEPASPPYALGALTTQRVVLDSGGATLHDRRLPQHGVLTLENPPAAPVAVSFPAGPLTVERTNAADPADAAKLLLDFGATPAPWAALKPAVERAVLARRCAALTASARTREAVTANLLGYADGIRPRGWNADPKAGAAFDEIFHGSRTPWNYVGARQFERLFDAMDLIAFPAAPPTPRRPSHALLLWLMEGMVKEMSTGLLTPGFHRLSEFVVNTNTGATLDLLLQYTAAERTGATKPQIATAIRVALFWFFYGLDVNNAKIPGAADNLPDLRTPIAAATSGQDAAWKRATDAIVAAGITPPDRATVIGLIDVRHAPADATIWEFRLKPGWAAAIVACQYAEYLSRVVALPAGAQRFASFGYAAYNAGVPSAAALFSDADATLAADPAKWAGKTQEDVLKTRRIGTVKTPRGSGTDRSTDPQVQALHVAALDDAWARHLPGLW